MGSTSVSPRNDWISPSRWSRSQGTRGELGAVRLLVQAHPEPEVVGLHVEFALHVDDVRGDEQQPAAAVRARRQVAGGRGEGLVLAEDPGGQERQQHAQLDAGDLAADGAEDGAAGGAAAPFLHLVQQRLEHLPEPGDVRPDPAGAVDDEDGGVVGGVGAHPGEAADVFLRGLRVPAQLRDDGPGLVAAHVGARPHEPGRGRHREIPVDHPADAAPPMLVMRQRYVSGSHLGQAAAVDRGRAGRRGDPVARSARSRTPPGPSPRRSRAAWASVRAGGVAGQEGEGQQAAVVVDDRARQRVHAGQGAGLGPYDACRAVRRSGCSGCR